MALTTAIAAIMILPRVLPQAFGDDIDVIEVLAVLLVFGICFGSVTLAALWAALGLGNPAVRVPFVFLLSAAGSVLMAFCLPGGKEDWMQMFVLAIGDSAIALASLLVVRSCGYRLVPRAAAETPV
jgi:hypothetical protein